MEWLETIRKGDLVRMVTSEKKEDFCVIRIHEVEDKRVSVVTNCGSKRWFSKDTGRSISNGCKYNLLPKER